MNAHLISFVEEATNGTETGPCADIQPWEKHGGVAIYIAVLLLIFYLMELICDEFFVPALNILSEKLHLSDDVAGATFMAAGASSPELFVSLTAVLSGSAVGVGTVVGSELFNMLCICGGSALVASSTLHLNWRTLAREVIFYGLSIFLLLYVLTDKKVSVTDAVILVSVYSSYVLTCAKYDLIVRLLCREKPLADKGLMDDDEEFAAPPTKVTKGSLNAPNIESGSLLSGVNSPVVNSEHVLRPSIQQLDDEKAATRTQRDSYSVGHNSYEAHLTLWDARQATSLRSHSHMDDSVNVVPRIRKTISRNARNTLGGNSQPMNMKYRNLSTGLGLPEEYEESNMRMHGFLTKKSRFYSKANITSMQWQRRWFMLKRNGTQLRYCRNPIFPTQNLRVINLIVVEKIESEGQFDIILHSPEQKYQLRAKDSTTRNAWKEALSQQLSRIQLDKSRGRLDESTQSDEDESEDHDHLLTWPHGTVQRIVFIFSFPVVFLMHFTIPDPRNPKWTKFYVITLLMVVVWLAGMSYVLVTFSDKTGCILHIPEDLMGLTIGSIGTSLPNLFASMLVARQGLGNMAVSNAFGSNVFNIFMALGIPWCIATIGVRHGQPYEVASDSINSTAILLAAFLAFFVIVMIVFRMRLTKQIGMLFLVLYVTFIAYMVLASVGVVPHM